MSYLSPNSNFLILRFQNAIKSNVYLKKLMNNFEKSENFVTGLTQENQD